VPKTIMSKTLLVACTKKSLATLLIRMTTQTVASNSVKAGTANLLLSTSKPSRKTSASFDFTTYF
jgi:hypothetical protein